MALAATMTDAARADRGRRAELMWDEFMSPAFEVVRAEYEARLREICAKRPWAANEISALANASRIAEEVEKQIKALVYDGKEALAQMGRAEKIASMSPQRRKVLGLSLPG